MKRLFWYLRTSVRSIIIKLISSSSLCTKGWFFNNWTTCLIWRFIKSHNKYAQHLVQLSISIKSSYLHTNLSAHLISERCHSPITQFLWCITDPVWWLRTRRKLWCIKQFRMEHLFCQNLCSSIRNSYNLQSRTVVCISPVNLTRLEPGAQRIDPMYMMHAVRSYFCRLVTLLH